jgi:hypothetical protein
MGTKKLTVIATSEASLESIQNSVISVVNQRRAKDQENNYIGDVFAVQHKAQFYVVDDDFIATVKSDGNVLKTDYITATKLGEELAKIPSSGTVTLDEDKINELIDNKISTLNLSSKANVSDVYTKSEVDEKVATISSSGSVNLDGYVREEALANLATKDELRAKADISSLEGLATKDELSSKADSSELANLATKDEVNSKLDSSTYTADKDTFATKAEIENKANKDEVYSKTEIDTMVEAIPTTDVDLSEYATTEQLNLALTAKADMTMVEGLATKDEVNEEIAKLATKDEITPISEKIVVIEESIGGLASKDEIVTLDELTPINAKLTEIDALIPNFATSGDLMGFANMDDVRLELAAKADISVVETLATKAELGSYALKSEVPTGVEIDEEQVARAVRESSKIQELSSAVANLSSNLQGATYPQVAAILRYCGYDIPSDLTTYDPYSLKELKGDTVLTIKVEEVYNDSYATLQNLKITSRDNKVYTLAKYYGVSTSSAILYFKEKDIVPKLISEVVSVDGSYAKEEGEIEVHVRASSAYSTGYEAYRIGLDENSGWCSSGNGKGERFEIIIKDFIPAKVSVRTGYENNTHLITKCGFSLTCGELIGEELKPNEGSLRRDMEISLVDIDLNVRGEKFVELSKAWNISPIAYVPNYSVGNISNLVGSVSSDEPFVFSFRGLGIYSNSYGTAVSNIEFFNESGERLYPKFAYLSSGDNEATYILTPKEEEKINALTTVTEGYQLLEGEKKVVAIRHSAQYDSSYTFAEALLYTAKGAYDHEYLVGNNGDGLVNIEFRCDFVPSKVQYIQSPYGHGKAIGYEAVVDGVQVATALYAGGSYDYEILDFANARVKVPKGSFNFDYEAVNRSDMGSEFDTNQAGVSIVMNKLTNTITVSGDINDLVSYASSNPEQGSHKWVGIGIKTGLDSVDGVSVNDNVLDTSADEAARINGLSKGSFVFWFKADTDGSGRTLRVSKGDISSEVKVVFNQVDKEINPDDSQKVEPENTQGESVNNQNQSDIIVID